MLQEIEDKAVRTFMTLEGIEGPSTYQHEVGSVELESWNHGFKQPTQKSRQAGSAASAGKAKHRNLIIEKLIDKTSADLIKKCWEGNQIPTVRIATYNADVKFLEITMEKVIVSELELVDDATKVVPVEELKLDYAKITYNYQPVDEAGKAAGNITISHCLESDLIS